MKFCLLIPVILLLSCAKSSETVNRKPLLELSYAADGLHLQLSGSATDPDGEITNLTISWGDSKVNNYGANDFSQISISHTYVDPGTFDIQVSAIDNEGDSASQTLSVVVDFKETSLNGIKQGLFKTAANEYLILTINLHTYQESMQNEKFNLITDLIGLMDIDFVALQECAQHKNSPIVQGIIRDDNMALEIARRLKQSYDMEYNYVWNWAHYGWEVWEEGVAVLSKHPLLDSDERYVSTATGTNTISSRKVIYGAYQIPEGRMHVFSAHTHWRTSLSDEEQNKQIENIKTMVAEKEAFIPDAMSWVCGDFNVNPTSDFPWSEGYNTMVKNGTFKDSFLSIYPDANNRPAQAIYNTIGGSQPGRIDYIFMKQNNRMQVIESQIVFTGNIIGKVSDHYGVLTKLVVH